MPQRVLHLLGTEEVWLLSSAQTHAGVEFRVPSLTVRCLHNFVHAQVVPPVRRLYRHMELRQLYEFVRLQQGPDEAVDWVWLRERVDGGGAGHALRAYLLAAEQWMGQPLPPELRVTAGARRLDRRLRQQIARPRLGRALYFLEHYSGRLLRAPKRLLTPSWYRTKLHLLIHARHG